MIIATGEKVHIVYRALYENSTRRHFLGEIIAVEGALCRLEGYAFVYDKKSTMYVKKPDSRMTIVDLGESGYIVNVVNSDVILSEVNYKYLRDFGLVATDDKSFVLNINEFGVKS
ncbi:MAG: hypothetical protein K6L75_11765 [Cellvibrionaceae bacterium]